jgi:hypothetical protein
MPKSTKVIPAQQSSLKEMWGGKKLHHTGQPDASSSGKEDDASADANSEPGENFVALVSIRSKS